MQLCVKLFPLTLSIRVSSHAVSLATVSLILHCIFRGTAVSVVNRVRAELKSVVSESRLESDGLSD